MLPPLTSLIGSGQVAAAVRASAAAANIIGQEQPCRVLLRLWKYDPTLPPRALHTACLAIPDTVLCSEMGVHISPCGRFLAACVASQVRLLTNDHLTSMSRASAAQM